MIWLIKFAIFGLVAGALARLVHPGRDPMTLFWTMILGMAGAVVGGWIGETAGFNVERGLMSWVCAIAGSVGLLVIYYAATRRTALTNAGPATSQDYKSAVFNDLSRGPRG